MGPLSGQRSSARAAASENSPSARKWLLCPRWWALQPFPPPPSLWRFAYAPQAVASLGISTTLPRFEGPPPCVPSTPTRSDRTDQPALFVRRRPRQHLRSLPAVACLFQTSSSWPSRITFPGPLPSSRFHDPHRYYESSDFCRTSSPFGRYPRLMRTTVPAFHPQPPHQVAGSLDSPPSASCVTSRLHRDTGQLVT